MKTVEEVRLKLQEEEHPPEAVSFALARLQELRVLDDAAFARAFASHKWRASQWGAPRIRQALAQRRVPPPHAEAALAALFGPGGDASDEPGCGAEDDRVGRSADLLLNAARKQWRLSRGLAEEARVRRLTGWLSRRGHAWRTVHGIVQTLQAEAASDEAARQEEDGEEEET